ncbi:MAG: DUF3014 domain-containing protein [Thermoanaerobaculia bacterium]
MEFDQYSPPPEPIPEPPARRVLWPWAVALLIIVVGVVAYLLLRGTEPAPPPPLAAPPAAATDERSEEPVGRALELPRLGTSDDWLRRVVGELSTHPELARWLVSDNLVRRFTAAVDNVARGESPRPHLGFLGPAGPFAVVERGGDVYPDPRGYARYDRVAEVIDSLDAAGAAELYRQLEPLLQEGYADLGYPNRDFDDALGRAIGHLLATPLPAEQPPLELGVESYAYRDPRIESLSPAQKHLLRTGPGNAAVILDKLREIAGLLDLLGE